MNAMSVVQRQLDAYNARDLDRFVAEYSDDITMFRPPSPEPFIAGKAQLAEYYRSKRFVLPALNAQLVNRMVIGSHVIDHERITGVRDDAFEVAAVYEVVDGRIRSAWFFG